VTARGDSALVRQFIVWGVAVRKRVWLVLLAVAVLAGSASLGGAKDKEKDKKPAAATGGKAPSGVTLNACGCYKNASGACVCTDRKAKCECEGDCEPVGCDERRQKEIEREMAAEVKRAQEEDKKREAAEKAAEAAAANPGGTEAEKTEDTPGEKPGDKPSDKDKAEAAEPAAKPQPPAAPPSKPAKQGRKVPREKK